MKCGKVRILKIFRMTPRELDDDVIRVLPSQPPVDLRYLVAGLYLDERKRLEAELQNEQTDTKNSNP
jgi:hypothetical protein